MYEFLFWVITPVLVVGTALMFILFKTNKIDNIGRARELMKEAFEADPDFKEVYISNIDMLLSDRCCVQDPKQRNAAAKDILHMVFWEE